jgi:hypothetical protein
VHIQPTIPVVDEYLAKAVASVSGFGMEKHNRPGSKSSTHSGARNEPDEALFQSSVFCYIQLGFSWQGADTRDSFDR